MNNLGSYLFVALVLMLISLCQRFSQVRQVGASMIQEFGSLKTMLIKGKDLQIVANRRTRTFLFLRWDRFCNSCSNKFRLWRSRAIFSFGNRVFKLVALNNCYQMWIIANLLTDQTRQIVRDWHFLPFVFVGVSFDRFCAFLSGAWLQRSTFDCGWQFHLISRWCNSRNVFHHRQIKGSAGLWGRGLER